MSRNPRYVDVVETAKLVRSALKSAFPGVKFSVRSDKYAGGASIDVSWTDGPFEKDVERVTSRYQACDFDGMQDMRTYRPSTLVAFGGEVEDVQFGAHYVQTHRKLSDAYLAELEIQAQAVLRDYAGYRDATFDRNAWYEGIPTPAGVFPNGNGHNLLWFLSREFAPGAPVYTPSPWEEAAAGHDVPASEPTPEEAPAPQFFCDHVLRVMSGEDESDPVVGMFLATTRGYLIARDEAPFAFDVLKGYRLALLMMLAVDAGLPGAEDKIDATISEALAYWMRRGYR
jgi:hypothetical protein